MRLLVFGDFGAAEDGVSLVVINAPVYAHGLFFLVPGAEVQFIDAVDKVFRFYFEVNAWPSVVGAAGQEDLGAVLAMNSVLSDDFHFRPTGADAFSPGFPRLKGNDRFG